MGLPTWNINIVLVFGKYNHLCEAPKHSNSQFLFQKDFFFYHISGQFYVSPSLSVPTPLIHLFFLESFYVVHANFELVNPPASTSLVLELQAYGTSPVYHSILMGNEDGA